MKLGKMTEDSSFWDDSQVHRHHGQFFLQNFKKFSYDGNHYKLKKYGRIENYKCASEMQISRLIR